MVRRRKTEEKKGVCKSVKSIRGKERKRGRERLGRAGRGRKGLTLEKGKRKTERR